MSDNFFIKYLDKGRDRIDLAYMYIGAVSSVLENEQTPKEQIKRLNELWKYYNEALDLIKPKQEVHYE